MWALWPLIGFFALFITLGWFAIRNAMPVGPSYEDWPQPAPESLDYVTSTLRSEDQ